MRHSGRRRSVTGSVASSMSTSVSTECAREKREYERLVRGKVSRSVWLGRILNVLCLSVFAAVLGFCAYFFLSEAERKFAQSQFDSITDRALAEAVQISSRNKWSISTMAEMAAQTHPDPDEWPFVTFPGYVEIVEKLHQSAGISELLSVAPLVKPDQLPQWLDFAYDYFKNVKGYALNETARYNEIGKGVWITAGDGKNITIVKDTTGIQKGSPHQVLFPVFQSQMPGIESATLLFNLRAGSVRTQAIDSIIESEYTNSSSGAISDMIRIGRRATRGPAALLYQGIYPPGPRDANNNNSPRHQKPRLTGLLATILLLDQTLDNIFPDRVNGVECVIKNERRAFTYSIVNGKAQTKGDGDLHDPTYEKYRRHKTLTDHNLYTENSLHYTVEIYPTNAFYEFYRTNNPKVATIGAVFCIVITALFFFVFDCFVRKEFKAKGDLLEAKRRFMRFVSHEVRTPLNSVCMGLALIEKELNSLRAESSSSSNRMMPEHSVNDDETKEPEEVDVRRGEGCSTKKRIHTKSSAATVDDCLCTACEIQTMADSAVSILNDILNYDKIENGTLALELSFVPILKLVEITVKEFVLPAIKKDIKLKMIFQAEVHPVVEDDIEACPDSTRISVEATDDLPMRVQRLRASVDIVRMKQVIRNLVSNAIKFTPERGTITVRTMWKEQSSSCDQSQVTAAELGVNNLGGGAADDEDFNATGEGTIYLRVTDTGAGMSAEQLSSLFRPGVQFNANKLQAGGGSGLGLYIARGIVEQHKGRLVADSDGLGKGTTFMLNLPVYSIPQKHDRTKLAVPSANSRTANDESVIEDTSLKILVVDDAVSNRKLLCRLLKMEGHVCDQAENGQIALDTMKRVSDEGETMFDVVLMDYEMPVLDGPSATSAIRKAGYEVFIVGITGNVLPEDVQHFRSCGANIVLPKPLRLPDLKSIFMEHGLTG